MMKMWEGRRIKIRENRIWRERIKDSDSWKGGKGMVEEEGKGTKRGVDERSWERERKEKNAGVGKRKRKNQERKMTVRGERRW